MSHGPSEYCRNCCCRRPVRSEVSEGVQLVVCRVCDEVIPSRSGFVQVPVEAPIRARQAALSDRPATKEFGARWFANWRKECANA